MTEFSLIFDFNKAEWYAVRLRNGVDQLCEVPATRAQSLEDCVRKLATSIGTGVVIQAMRVMARAPEKV